VNNTYYIPCGADVYEVGIRNSVITRIVKIMGDTQLRFPIEYEELSLEARWAINDYIENLNNHE
jgi:hypothetical protein